MPHATAEMVTSTLVFDCEDIPLAELAYDVPVDRAGGVGFNSSI